MYKKALRGSVAAGKAVRNEKIKAGYLVGGFGSKSTFCCHRLCNTAKPPSPQLLGLEKTRMARYYAPSERYG
jgi:hypothetical protein